MKRNWMLMVGGVVAVSTLAMAEPPTMQPALPPLSPATQPAAETPASTPPVLDTVLAGRPDEAPTTRPLLGAPYTSQAAGISLTPPAGCKAINRAGGDSIVEFVSEERKIGLRITKSNFSKATKLSIPPDAPGPTINGEKERGLLEMTVAQYKTRLPNQKLLRQDVLPVAGHDAGIVMLRATVGVHPQLIQQAIIQQNEQSYYNLILTTPGLPFDAPSEKADATEMNAAATFRAILETVQLLDPDKLRAEQVDRLFRTRTMFVNWTEAKVRSVLIPEQWMRVIRDGKDIGYSYIVEEPETRGVNPGIKIGIRSRTLPQAGQQVDAETWYHVSFDRKIEDWSSIALFTEPKEKYYATEFGSSIQRRKPVADNDPMAATQPVVKGDNVRVKLVDTYRLAVHRVTKKVTTPDIERELPPFYLAQGFGHLLPRLVPKKEPAGFMFYYYVSGDAEVKLRYIDVGLETTAFLAGKKITAIPITDRLGYDGAPTIHYIESTGQYLGSITTAVNEDGEKSVVSVVPTDRDTLNQLWKDANLVRPEEAVAPR